MLSDLQYVSLRGSPGVLSVGMGQIVWGRQPAALQTVRLVDGSVGLGCEDDEIAASVVLAVVIYVVDLHAWHGVH